MDRMVWGLSGSSANARPSSRIAVRRDSSAAAPSAPSARADACSAASAWRVGHLAAPLHVAVAVEVALDGVAHLARAGVALGQRRRGGLDADGLELRRHLARRRAHRRARVGPVERGPEDVLRASRPRGGARARGARRGWRRASRRPRARRGRAGSRAAARAACTPGCRGASPAEVRPERTGARRSLRPVVRPELHEGLLRPEGLGQPPVEEVHLAEVAEHDVGRLEIAVDDAAPVHELERQAHAGHRGQELPRGVLPPRLLVAGAQGLEDLLQGVARARASS